MAGNDTPIMRQYQTIKAQHVGFLVMFRMGDFYEMLGTDAVTASGVLNITLTRRRTTKDEEGVPMCGVPYHAAEGYIGKLVSGGYKVALVEQVETPEEARAARGSGALVRREVVRLFTPGTLTEDSMLDATHNKFVVAVTGDADQPEATPAHLWRGALAWLDLSTGDTGVRTVGGATLATALAALEIGEAVAHPATEETLLKLLPRRLLNVQENLFNPVAAKAALARAYGVDVQSLGLPNTTATTALGAVVAYAELTQMGKLPTLKTPHLVSENTRLALDPATRRNLELTESLQGTRAGSLLACIDTTRTSAGSRLLARWLHEPLTDGTALAARQQAITALSPVLDQVQALLKSTTDIARAASRLTLGRGGPRDLQALAQTGQMLPQLKTLIAPLSASLLAALARQMDGLQSLTSTLSKALNPDNLPMLARDGGFIQAGYDTALDDLNALLTHSTELLQNLETEAQATSGVAALKVRYNKVWGYYFEVPSATAAKLAALPGSFIHRQTTTSTQRFTSDKLLTLERELAGAGANALRRELELYDTLVAEVKTASVGLLDAAEALATLDVLAAGASLNAREGWVLPELTNDGAFEVKQGRHPVVAATTAARGEAFTPNSCNLSNGQLWLMTGPNMAGKSTFLRQNAVICILAQLGYPVPAVSARVGVADAVFCRIGASDNLAAGQSTFMVEMVEAAHILNRATPKSLVVLDEIGRGTATYDGLAIAWAMTEDLARRGCRTLFATHYHELTALAQENGGVFNNVSLHRVAVKEWKGQIVFLHTVEDGAAEGSYGVQVAKLAGVPNNVVARAETLLNGFLKSAGQTRAGGVKGVARLDELTLFASTPQTIAAPQKPSEVQSRLEGLDVDTLSPREALAELYDLKALLH